MTFLFSILILFFELLISIFCQLPIWNLKNSSIDLLSSSDSYNYIMYDERRYGFHIKLEKNITKKENGEISLTNYIQKNDDEKEVIEFDDIYRFLSLPNKKYICPKGKNYLYEYSSDQIKDIKHYENEITDNWFFNCGLYNNRIIISYLGSNDNNIYAFNLITNSWENYKFKIFDQENWQMKDIVYYRYYDIIFPNENKEFGMSLLLDNDGIQLAKIKFILNFNNILIENKKPLLNSNYVKVNSCAFFDEDKYLYWITYDNNIILSGYSNNPIQDDIEHLDLNNIEVQINFESPFGSMGNVQIKYINFIRNTNYIYYQIELNSENYYGVIDIKENKIYFNTKETIIEFKPLTKYSLLAITKSSAYEICINGKYNGKCRDKCHRGQNLIIDNENGNYCGGDEVCKVLLLPDNTCIGTCDEQYYIMDGNECGSCKNLNKTFPYKIINETKCIKEKPNNTYFIDESSYILKYCHYSCETCSGEGEYECTNCRDSFFQNNGKCDTNCPEHYYKNTKERKCSECDYNCKECDNEKENNNSHCISCESGKFLVIAKGFDNNCVDECPNNTKTDYNNQKCYIENDDGNNKGNNNNNDKKSTNNGTKSFNRLWVWIIIILIIIIIIIVAIVIFKKFCKKKNEEDVNLVLKSQDDFAVNQNESISQDWSVY